MQVLNLSEEMVDLAALLVTLGAPQDIILGLLCEVPALLGYGVHNLLQSTILTDDLGGELHVSTRTPTTLCIFKMMSFVISDSNVYRSGTL